MEHGVERRMRVILHAPCSKLHAENWSVRLDSHQHLPGYEPDALTVKLQTRELALPRGLAPRASAFARQCAGLLHLGSGKLTLAPVLPRASPASKAGEFAGSLVRD